MTDTASNYAVAQKLHEQRIVMGSYILPRKDWWRTQILGAVADAGNDTAKAILDVANKIAVAVYDGEVKKYGKNVDGCVMSLRSLVDADIVGMATSLVGLATSGKL